MHTVLYVPKKLGRRPDIIESMGHINSRVRIRICMLFPFYVYFVAGPWLNTASSASLNSQDLLYLHEQMLSNFVYVLVQIISLFFNTNI